MKHKHLISHIKMGKEIITFGNTEIEKQKFYCYDFLKDTNNILGSNKIFSGEKTISTLWLHGRL